MLFRSTQFGEYLLSKKAYPPEIAAAEAALAGEKDLGFFPRALPRGIPDPDYSHQGPDVPSHVGGRQANDFTDPDVLMHFRGLHLNGPFFNAYDTTDDVVNFVPGQTGHPRIIKAARRLCHMLTKGYMGYSMDSGGWISIENCMNFFYKNKVLETPLLSESDTNDSIRVCSKSILMQIIRCANDLRYNNYLQIACKWFPQKDGQYPASDPETAAMIRDHFYLEYDRMYGAPAVHGGLAMENQFPNLFQGENFPEATITHIRAADNICLSVNGKRCGVDDYTKIDEKMLGVLVKPKERRHGEGDISPEYVFGDPFATFKALRMIPWRDGNIVRYPGEIGRAHV